MTNQILDLSLIEEEIGGWKYQPKHEIHIRNAFVRKVLSITAFQLCLTAILTALSFDFYEIESLVKNKIVLWSSLAVTLGTWFALSCGLSKKSPMNWILLTIFTLAESVCVASTCHISVQMTGNANMIKLALGITACVTVGLALWALQTKRDFADYLGYAIVIAIALLAAGILNYFFFQSKTMIVITSAIGSVLFGFYLIYDLQRLFKKEIDLEDPICIALMIYVDIIVLFQEILRLLSVTNASDD